jgi:hypothetical protein
VNIDCFALFYFYYFPYFIFFTQEIKKKIGSSLVKCPALLGLGTASDNNLHWNDEPQVIQQLAQHHILSAYF